MSREARRAKRLRSDPQLVFDDYLQRGRHGGRRKGAGRPATRSVAHRSRPEISRDKPALVTLKLRRGLPSLRRTSLVSRLRTGLRALRQARVDFRVVQYSIQTNHIHLIIEAESTESLASGMKALGSRVARLVNRAAKRSGPVLRERYHLRVLAKPRQVRNALQYVLTNIRKHSRGRLPAGLDPASSACFVDFWRRCVPSPRRAPPKDVREVSPACSWLLSTGWRRWGPLDPDYIPPRVNSLRII